MTAELPPFYLTCPQLGVTGTASHSRPSPL
jgi:hypothetical protein